MPVHCHYGVLTTERLHYPLYNYTSTTYGVLDLIPDVRGVFKVFHAPAFLLIHIEMKHYRAKPSMHCNSYG